MKSLVDKYMEIVVQARIMTRQWDMLLLTPVVDDDFPEMKERFELELARLKRLLQDE